MSTAPPTLAYTTYSRRVVPASEGATGATVIAKWLATELRTIERAIPVRYTKTVTANYTLLLTDDVVLVNATGGVVTITWPDPTRAQHFTATVKKIDSSSHAVTFASTIAATSTAATFDGVTSPTLVSQWDSKTERSNGIEYYQKDAGVTAIFTGSVPAANVTSGTFGSATSDAGTYVFSHAMTVTGLATVGSLAIGATGKGFDASGNLSAVAGAFTAQLKTTSAALSTGAVLLDGGLGTSFNLLQIQQNSGSAILQVGVSGVNQMITGATINSCVFNNANNTDMIFATNSTVRLTIAGAGGATFAGSVTGGAASFTTGTFSGAIVGASFQSAAGGSFLIRNAANSGNLTVVDNSGADIIAFDPSAFGASFGGNIRLLTSAARIIGGATYVSFRDTANSNDNLLISNAGAVSVRGNMAIGGTPTATSPLNITGLPTSAVGLATGDIYSLAGTLHVV